MTKEKLQWHSAFLAALHIEFENELHLLNIEAEHLLGRKPMQMDVSIIKKEKETAIQKNIGRIFRQHNIIEYKNPGDYLSLNDFYKVYGYTCFYQSDTAHVNEIKPILFRRYGFDYPCKLETDKGGEKNVRGPERIICGRINRIKKSGN